MTALTAEKYAGQIAKLSTAMEQTIGEGILTARTLAEQEQRLGLYTRQEMLTKEQQKALVYFRTYKLLVQTDAEAKELHRPLFMQESDFDCWLHLANDLSTPIVRKQAIIINILRERGFDLFSCSTLCELQTQANAILSTEEDRNIIRAIVRICAYACSLLLPSERPSVTTQQNEARRPEENEYTRWCILRGGTKNTVKQQSEYVERVTAYVKATYGCTNLEQYSPEEALGIMLRLYGDAQAHTLLLSTQGERAYADLFCSYLLDKIDLATYTLPPDSPRLADEAPILITGDKRSVVAEYKNWVQEEWSRRGARISPGSIRTFASSLYACNSVLEEELGETEFDLFNPRSHAHAVLLKHRITHSASYKADHGGALWSYVAFLANRTILNTETQQQIRSKLTKLLNEQTDGQFAEQLAPTLPALWEKAYGEPLPNAPALLERITDELTIHSNGHRVLPHRLLTADEHARLEAFITAAFDSGCPVVDLEQLILFLNAPREQGITEDSLRRYLELTSTHLCDCDKNHIRRPGTEKQTQREVAAYMCEVIRNFGRPVNPEELHHALPYLSESTIQTTFTRNELGWNIGLVNPKRKHVFHADIISMTEEESATVALIIYKHLEEHGYMSSGQLHQAISTNKLPFAAERDFMDIAALYSTIRYKFKNLFSFNNYFITMRRDEQDDSAAEVDVNTKSIFLKFCEQNAEFSITDLLAESAKLGKTTIPFADIYNIVARVNEEHFVHAEQLKFDISATDEALSKLCNGTYPLLTEVMRNWQAPPVSGYAWTPHLMQYYLCYKSERFILLQRAFSKRAAHNGFVVPRTQENTSFEAALASYLAAQTELPLQEEPVLDFLLDRALIGARRYKELSDILPAAQALRGESPE